MHVRSAPGQQQKAEMGPALEGKNIGVLEKLLKEWCLDEPPPAAQTLVNTFKHNVRKEGRGGLAVVEMAAQAGGEAVCRR